jgi:hypothetical protein
MGQLPGTPKTRDEEELERIERELERFDER